MITKLQQFLSLTLLLIVYGFPSFAAVSEGPVSGSGSRLAIIVGNSHYQSARIERLPNTVNDAEALAESLKRLNFDVLVGTDLTGQGFDKLLLEADSRAAKASAVLFFYAGHGVRLGTQNFLLPVDTPDPDSLEKLTAGAAKLNDVIARFANRERPTFIFLDACRNNPVEGASGGLVEIEVGENTFVAFATQPGNVTVDGSGQNSPFTTALLKNLEIPGLSISDMMIRVRNETEALTFGRQVPKEQSDLREQFYFTEQQVLDPAQLSASLSQILSDPAAKRRLQVELASNDLQTAVLIVGQTLRSVGVASATNNEPAAGTQIASLSTQQGLDGARDTVVSELETLIVGSTATGGTDGDKAKDLARSVQTELRRLGCYRNEIDGDWGKGSQRALADYYRNTKQAVPGSAPSVELLGDLFLRSGRICKAPVMVKKIASSEAGGRTKAVGKVGRTQGGKTVARKPARAAAPPPDISGGIGIGGVF